MSKFKFFTKKPSTLGEMGVFCMPFFGLAVYNSLMYHYILKPFEKRAIEEYEKMHPNSGYKKVFDWDITGSGRYSHITRTSKIVPKDNVQAPGNLIKP